ncbi:ABC-type transporter Mla maintaining outer membrane lipid asymmetry, lipoprotein component MlaA [Roseateles sp. YR242]|uniref:MlaA family lipoprotein n=1 Tax=Roseateles sp. YR242 TaxID=1855305 RepID=UPI0008B58764|nr:VacJ family lipoprotein [Roseateles sp. YR242]SEL69363.1 ABC-type transporter Mla maintaining outer membrane lipid asymmetry, lipoprotein component MlaA [Roseateles sp. YR242]
MTHNVSFDLRAGWLSAALLAAALAAPAAHANAAPDAALEQGQAQAAEAADQAASGADASAGAAAVPPPAEATDAESAAPAAAPASAASGAEGAAGDTKVPAAAGQAGQAAQAVQQGDAPLPAPGPRVRNRLDPWEGWNRKVFHFNEKLDENVLRPVATAYSQLVPSPARQAVDNFFGNFSDAWSAVNLFLQGRFKTGAQQTMRVAVNSVLGLAGLIDIATPAGLEKTSEDLGRTLGYWGVKTGPYIVWPLLGPSNLRDSVTLPVNIYYSPAYLFDDGEYKVAISALQLINTRAGLLKVTDMLDGIALDKYTFVRDAYMQRRTIKARSSSDDEEDDYEVITPDEKPATP